MKHFVWGWNRKRSGVYSGLIDVNLKKKKRWYQKQHEIAMLTNWKINFPPSAWLYTFRGAVFVLIYWIFDAIAVRIALTGCAPIFSGASSFHFFDLIKALCCNLCIWCLPGEYSESFYCVQEFVYILCIKTFSSTSTFCQVALEL